MLKEIACNEAQKACYEQLQRLGAVGSIAIFDVGDMTDEAELMLSAALSAMELFSQHYLRSAAEFYNSYPEAEFDPEEHLIRVYEDASPKGQRVSFDDFLGKGYDLTTGKLGIFSYHGHARGAEYREGLTNALLNPPYGLKFETAEKPFTKAYGIAETRFLTGILRRFLEVFLHVQTLKDTTDLVIYSWSDDWSNYFDAGKEWWGSYYWTVLDKKRNIVTVIAASTTD